MLVALDFFQVKKRDLSLASKIWALEYKRAKAVKLEEYGGWASKHRASGVL